VRWPTAGPGRHHPLPPRGYFAFAGHHLAPYILPGEAIPISSDEIQQLREELAQARASEEGVRALLHDAVSFFASDDIDVILADLARCAVVRLPLVEVAIYRIDHDKGSLTGPVCAVACSDGVVRLESLSEMIAADSGDVLAEFAAGRMRQDNSDSYVRLPIEQDAEAGETLLMRMRPAAGPRSEGLMLGVVCASAPAGERLSDRTIELLGTLVDFTAGSSEHARIEQLRRQLISSVTHELRTPLASIRAYNELLLDGDAGPINEEQELFLQRIEATSMRLERLVNDLLDLSRLRAGELSIHKNPISVADIVDHTVNALQPEAMRGDIRLASVPEPNLPMIYSDADRLSQVLFNLIGNAIKYVGPSGDVQVRAALSEPAPDAGERWSDSAELIISVVDNGPGIAPEDLDKIFDEFQRGRGAEGMAKGAGLGLSIATRLIRLLGGKIAVQSTMGEGSIFSLSFPMDALAVS